MLKKLTFALALGVFAFAFSVSAQTKVDQYLGTWKMVSQPKDSKYKMITLNVSVDGDAFKVERIIEEVRDGKDVSSTTISSWKLSGASSTLLNPLGDFSTTYMSYLRNGKLRFGNIYSPVNVNQDPLQFNPSIREDWSLSSDGRTLTVGSRSRKFVYAKQ